MTPDNRAGRMKALAVLLFVLHLPSLTTAQSFQPIDVTGFNHDVIAESPTASPLATTTTEIDAFIPSNFVLFSEAYARSRSMPNGYGLPNDGRLIHHDKVFQMKDFTRPNALYLLKGSEGTLSITPLKLDAVSVLGLATEGGATLDVTCSFVDGTAIHVRKNFSDWFEGLLPVIKGMGRVKREDGPDPYYEGAPQNPKMYSIVIDLPEDKTLNAVTFRNISTGSNPESNRAVIFALSGYKKKSDPVVVPEPVVIVEEKKASVPQPTEPQRSFENIEVGGHVVLNDVLFKQSTAILVDQSYPQLDSVSNFLLKNPSIKIEVAGHTDSFGSKALNLKLSKDRAAEIKNYLIKSGVAADRIRSKGYGSSVPIAPNNTEESRQLNRRVEFVIISK